MTKMFENAIKAVNPNPDKRSIIPYAYDIGLKDMSDLLSLAHSNERDSVYRAIALAYEFGFVMGNRCTIRRKMKLL